jgi:hypothetical protein
MRGCGVIAINRLLRSSRCRRRRLTRCDRRYRHNRWDRQKIRRIPIVKCGRFRNSAHLVCMALLCECTMPASGAKRARALPGSGVSHSDCASAGDDSLCQGGGSPRDWEPAHGELRIPGTEQELGGNRACSKSDFDPRRTAGRTGAVHRFTNA